jgi:hypothetical protein
VAGMAIPATNPFLRPLPDIPLGRRALPDIPFGRRRANSLREHELMKMLLSSITQLSPKKRIQSTQRGAVNTRARTEFGNRHKNLGHISVTPL